MTAMGSEPDRAAELRERVARYCDGVLSAEETAELEQSLRDDPRAMDIFLLYMEIHSRMAWDARAHREAEDRGTADSPSAPPIVIDATPGERQPRLGLFAVGGPLFSYTAAAIILGLIVLTAWVWNVSFRREMAGNRPRAMAPEKQTAGLAPTDVRPPKSDEATIGHVTGLANCRWANARDALTDATAVSQGRKCTLLSGMMEITYRSGARVILEGPCDYQVDPAGGYLRLGKLTARVEKSEKRNPKSENRSPLSPLPSPLFTVRTPTATVTDLGTEFGVEVDARGDAAAHVLQGKIEVRPAVGDRGAPAKHGDASDVAGNRPIRLVVGQSVRVVKDADGHKLHIVPGKADAAAFPARPGHLAEYVQQQRSGLFRRWQAYSEELRKRGDLLAYYDFQPDTGEPLAVRNRAATGHAFDGWIRGGNWGVGSLPGKWAVRCTKPGDGVHVELSAKCRQITMALWLRVDALPKDEDREFGLLMSDGWSGSGRTHWTIRRDGTVWLSFTGLPTGDAGNLGQSSVTVGKNDLGRWRFLAVASDLAQGKTRFYVDGALAAEKAFAASDSAEFDIGPAMIGNWNDMGQPPADNRVLSGCVEEAMLFRTTLSEKEIHWLFRRGGLSRDGGNSATPDKPVESLGAK